MGGCTLNPDSGDLDVRANWGYFGQGGTVMPAKGRATQRAWTGEEHAALGEAATALGPATYDVYRNDVAYWRNVPARVWAYTIGGYQVIKKWLSYRERAVLGRTLSLDEARDVTHMTRRIAAILLLEAQLDVNYTAIKQAAYAWT